MKNTKRYSNKIWLEKQYNKGYSISNLARKCGVSVSTISRWLVHFRIRELRVYTGDRKGSKNPYWKGGKYKDRANGYILIYNPTHPFANHKGYIREHRLIMERHMGRYLRKNEIVHHRNKKKDDNRIKNLELIILGAVNYETPRSYFSKFGR